MLRATKRIIITSDCVNSHGFRVLTDGIDITQYEKNPIMLWMHFRTWKGTKDEILPIGNVIELRRETDSDGNKIITGQPVFDDSDTFAKSIYDKYENGTLRMASAGLDPISWSEEAELLLPGQTGYTLVKSKLREVSIADIGSNDDALSVALYDDMGKMITLSDKGENATIPQLTNTKNTDMSNLKLTAAVVAVKLGLDSASTEEVVLAAVDQLITGNQTLKLKAEDLQTKLTTSETKISDLEKAANETKIIALVDKAVDERKITAGQKEHYVKLAKQDFDSVSILLSGMAAATSIQKTIETSADKSQARVAELVKLSYDQLFADGGLQELKTLSPEDYKEKFKEKHGKEPLNS